MQHYTKNHSAHTEKSISNSLEQVCDHLCSRNNHAANRSAFRNNTWQTASTPGEKPHDNGHVSRARNNTRVGSGRRPSCVSNSTVFAKSRGYPPAGFSIFRQFSRDDFFVTIMVTFLNTFDHVLVVTFLYAGRNTMYGADEPSFLDPHFRIEKPEVRSPEASCVSHRVSESMAATKSTSLLSSLFHKINKTIDDARPAVHRAADIFHCRWKQREKQRGQHNTDFGITRFNIIPISGVWMGVDGGAPLFIPMNSQLFFFIFEK